MRSGRPPSRFALLLPFAAVIALFLGASAYSAFSERAIEEEARTIADRATPRIRRLAAARGEVRALKLLTARYVQAALSSHPIAPAEVVEAQARLGAEVRAYAALPALVAGPDASELTAWPAVAADMQAVEHGTGQVIAHVREGRADAAQAVFQDQVEPAADRAAAGLIGLIESNAQRAHELAASVAGIRRRSARIALLLDALGLLAGSAIALAALRASRHYYALLDDHRRAAEARADELEQFAGRMAHDIRNPLSAVHISLYTLRMHGRVGPEGAASLERAEANVAIMARTIEGLLSFARAGARPEPGAQASVRWVLADLGHELSTAAAEAGVELDIDAGPPATVACSPGVLTSLIANLAYNAIKYIGDGPPRRVTIAVRTDGKGPAEGQVRVEVADTGPGLPAGLEKTVFEPYVRGPDQRQPGIGLGLATVKRIAEAHGGTVGVESRPGAGCRFWFVLPRAGQVVMEEAKYPRKISQAAGKISAPGPP